MSPNPDDATIRALLTTTRTIAVVGASSSPMRSSHGVMARLQRAGYRVIPVNPNEREVLGVPAVARLADVGEHVDVVDVFRRPEHTPEVAREAVAIGARALWLQQGVINEDAAAIARAGGLVVVQDACLAVLVSVLRVPPPR